MKYEESPGSCNFEGFCFFCYRHFNSFLPASIIAYAIFLRNILCILFKIFCAVVWSIFMGCPPVKTYFPFLFSELLLTLPQQQLASELY